MSARSEEYDAVVVGARCAGAATAMLMARAGLRVLLLDRVHPSRDTLSTHALMRAGVLQLRRWGLLERIVAAGTPAGHRHDLPLRRRRRDRRARRRRCTRRGERCSTPRCWRRRRRRARRARLGVDVTDLVPGPDRPGHRRARPRPRRRRGVVPGAAHRSGPTGCARRWPALAGARTARRGTAASAIVYGYWPSPGLPHYEWFYRPGVSAGDHPDQRRPGLRLGRAARADASPTSAAAGWTRVFARVLAEAAPAAVDAGRRRRTGRSRCADSPGCPPSCGAPPARLGAGRRRRLLQGPADRARHHRRPARRGVPGQGGRQRRRCRSTRPPATACRAPVRRRRVDRSLRLGHAADPAAAARRERGDAPRDRRTARTRHPDPEGGGLT